jgi:hypothetical protein
MTSSEFRRIALGMQDAIEAAHMGHPDFRVNGRIFATLSSDHKQGMVQLTPDQQRVFIDAHPDTFRQASGAWGRNGSTMVQLAEADADTIGDAMTLAWQGAVNRPAPRRRTTARPAARRTRR